MDDYIEKTSGKMMAVDKWYQTFELPTFSKCMTTHFKPGRASIGLLSSRCY